MRHTLEILVAVPSIASAMAICMTVLEGQATSVLRIKEYSIF